MSSHPRNIPVCFFGPYWEITMIGSGTSGALMRAWLGSSSWGGPGLGQRMSLNQYVVREVAMIEEH
jgi:hypothetical protein